MGCYILQNHFYIILITHINPFLYSDDENSNPQVNESDIVTNDFPAKDTVILEAITSFTNYEACSKCRTWVTENKFRKYGSTEDPCTKFIAHVILIKQGTPFIKTDDVEDQLFQLINVTKKM